MSSRTAGSTADSTTGSRNGAPPLDWVVGALIVAWCLLLIIGYPDDIALSWDETDHVGALFHYKAFFTAVLQPNFRQVPWTEFGNWGAGLDYYPPTYALLLGLVSAIFGVSMTEVRLFTIVQGALTLWLLERCIRRYSSRTVARWAVGLLAMNPWFLVFSRRLMLDIPQVCFLVGCLYYLICVETETEPIQPRRFFLLSLPWFAFAALTRITAAPFLLGAVVLWVALRKALRSRTTAPSRLGTPFGLVPIAVCCLTFGVWLLTSHVLKASLALHGHRSFLEVLRKQNLIYLRWLFLEFEPFWGLLWAASVCWCLWRRESLHLLTIAILLVTHLTIASLHNPAGMDFRFYLPVMPFLCFAGADLLASGASTLLGLRKNGLSLQHHPLWVTLGVTGLVLLGRWRYNKDNARMLESTSSGVLRAIRGALPGMQPTSYVGTGEAAEAKFFLAMEGSPSTYRVDERLGRFAHAGELPPQWDWLIFDQAELDRSPTLPGLLDEVRQSGDWHLETSAGGSPTELSHVEVATGLIFRRVKPPPPWTARCADHCAGTLSQGVCRRSASSPGLVAAGPAWELAPGRYEGTVTLTVSEAHGSDDFGRIEVTTEGRRHHVADIPLLHSDVGSESAPGKVSFEVSLPAGGTYEFLIWSSGVATLDPGVLTLQRLPAL